MLDADVLIIGSGAGGMAAAVALSQAGKSVIVLERHELPGGWCHSFSLEGYRYSPGVHYLGAMQPGQLGRELFEGLGLGADLELFELNPDGFDHVWVGDLRFDIPAGSQRLADRLSARFPNDERGVRDYIGLVEAISREIGAFTDVRGFWDILTMPYRTRHVGRFGMYSLERILTDRINDPLLRGLLSVQCGDHGMAPSRVPFGMHAAVVGHYLDGGCYPRGGGGGLVTAWLRALRRAGGRIELNTPVAKILIEGSGRKRRAIGVELEDGRTLRADRVISNADPHTTYMGLVGQEHLSSGLIKKLARTQYTVAAVSLFGAIDLDLRALGLDSRNYWVIDNPDAKALFDWMADPKALETPEVPATFVTFTTLKDPVARQDGMHTFEAFTFVNYEAFAAWKGASTTDRVPGYAELKAQLTDKMLRKVERLVPGLRDHLVFSEMGTPLTNEHYVSSTRGAAYGTEKTLNQIGPFAFRTQTEIPGLSHCGASMVSHGVVASALSGVDVSAQILGCRVKELLAADPAPLRIYSADDTSAWPEELLRKLPAARAAEPRRVNAPGG